MRGYTLVVAVVLVASLSSPGAGAEGDGSERFYVTATDVGTGDACSDDGRQYEGSNTKPEAGKAYGGTSAVGVACGFSVTYTTTEDYQLSGDVAIEFWSNCEAGATIEQDYTLIIDGVTIAEIRGGDVGPCATAVDPIKGGGTHASKDLFVPAGSAVYMRFALFSGPDPGTGPAGNAYITVGGDMPSGFAVAGWGIPFVPVDDSGPATLFENLTAPVVEVAFDNATSDDHVYNFTNALAAAVASFDVNGTGFANATLIDATGTELFNGTAETRDLDLGNVTTGDWQLLVDFTEFNGTFAFQLSEPVAVADDVDSADTDADATGNATTNGTAGLDGADQESPGIALPLLGLGLLAVAGARRR